MVRNAGLTAVPGDFWVDLYLNPTAAPTPGNLWPDLSGSGAVPGACATDPTCYGRAWLVKDGIGPNATVTLRTSDRPTRATAGGP